MACPICNSEPLPDDASIASQLGTRVIVLGSVTYINSPEGGQARTPFGGWYTVTVYPNKSGAKYLKFKDKAEFERWSFVVDEKYEVAGCLHTVDGKELIFDLTRADTRPR